MKLEPQRREDRIAEQKRLIAQQQEIAATLCRRGQMQEARTARGKLFALLNQLDLMLPDVAKAAVGHKRTSS